MLSTGVDNVVDTVIGALVTIRSRLLLKNSRNSYVPNVEGAVNDKVADVRPVGGG